MNPRDKRPLTRNEMMSLYLAAQSALGGKYRIATLQRAMAKLNFQMMDARHKAVYAKGKRDARAKRKPESEFGGHHLGSMESMTYYDGYAFIDKSFVNPYRSPSARWKDR